MSATHQCAAPCPHTQVACGLLALPGRMLTLLSDGGLQPAYRGSITQTLLAQTPMTYVEAASAPLRKTGQIKIHGPAAFEGMRRAGLLAAECLDMLAGEIRSGVSTERIDRLVYAFGMEHGAMPATLMYRGYRKSTCTSVNHVVCHGIPSEKPLRDGDILNVDVTLILDHWHGDSSRMYTVGEIPRRAERLIEVTYEAMMRGIAAIKPGATTGDVGYAIQSYVEAQHMSVVRDFCGHGVGRLFHDEPNIVHVGRPGEGIVLKPGMFFTVEPMINLGRPHVKVLSDGWTAVTRDRSLSAQFEHSVGVTPAGAEIFTLSPKGLDKPPYRV
jgi:methionyl aminopeptidase